MMAKIFTPLNKEIDRCRRALQRSIFYLTFSPNYDIIIFTKSLRGGKNSEISELRRKFSKYK